MTTLTTNCRTILAQLRERWDYGTAGILADAFGDAGDTLNQALWMVLANPHEDKHRLAYARECEREVEKPRPVCAECNGKGMVPGRGVVAGVGWDGRSYAVPNATYRKCLVCKGKKRTGTIREPLDRARAEFIRVQCELAKTGKFPWMCSDLRRRERELHSENWNLWWPQDLDAIQVLYTRGFVESVTCTAADWIRHAQAIRECQPVTSVRLNMSREETLAFIFGSRVSHINGHDFISEDFPGITFTLPGD